MLTHDSSPKGGAKKPGSLTVWRAGCILPLRHHKIVKQFSKQKFAEQLGTAKAFSLRRRWQPEGLTDEVVCDSTNSPKPLIYQRFCLPHTSSVAYGDSFSSRRSLNVSKEPLPLPLGEVARRSRVGEGWG